MPIFKKFHWLAILFLSLAVAILYSFVIYGCLKVAFEGTGALPVWLPSGVAFIAVWFLGYRIGPSLWLGTFMANMVLFIHHGWASIPAAKVSALIGVGYTMEALLAVFLLRIFTRQAVVLFKIRDIFKFILAVLLACLPSAVIGVYAVCFTRLGEGVSLVMCITWWLADVVGILATAPLVLTFQKKLWQIRSWQRALEALLGMLALVAVNFAVFIAKTPGHGLYSHVSYLILPFAIGATYRFSFPGATLSVVITSVFAILASVFHTGPFIGLPIPENLILVQFLIGVITVTVLTLAAALCERQKAEEDIKRREERFRSLVENSFEIIALVDAKGMVLYTSSPVKYILGYDCSESLGHGMLKWVHPEDIPNIVEAFKRLLSTPGGIAHTAWRMKRKDGIWRWMEGSGHNLIDVPSTGAIIVNYRDITERKLAEEVLKRDKESLEHLVDERSKELIKTQKELKHVSRLADIGTLAASVAHELRNPLGVIELAAYNLKKGKGDLGTDKHLANIEKKVWEGNQIIDNLLSYSRIKIPNYENVRILDILDECLTSTRERFAEKGVILEKEYGDGLDIIEADPNQIREVFLNILNNACQSFAGHGGKVELRVGCDGGMAKVSVKDAGVGIAQEDMEHVFEPFFTRKAKGTGLGLTICNELVHLHHGRIEINSSLRKGTTVSIFLPVHREGGGELKVEKSQ